MILFSCRETYNPPITQKDLNFLVVEGNITVGNDSTFIQLSRSIIVDTVNHLLPEDNATVTVESSNGDSYNLIHTSEGRFVAAPLNLNASEQYRLHIITGGKEYVSDYTDVIITPDIDSVSYAYNNENGLNIYSNTHDAQNKTRYYRYDYAETWQHNAAYLSELVFNPEDSTITTRTPDQLIYRCWTVMQSSDINLASTADISNNILSNNLLVSIPPFSEKLSIVYSIIVTQYALTKDAYNFWFNLRKNTEQIGSLFDPQPFANAGNMHCLTDSNEVVIGFVTAGTVSQKRIFIKKDDINWQTLPSLCRDSVPHGSEWYKAIQNFVLIPLRIDNNSMVVTGYECADCRAHGGSVIKPPYMP